MIQANELRIGNWLEFNLHGSKWIGQIDHTDFEFIFDNDLRCANPIPLNEDWFNKFEFENDNANGYSKDSIHIEYIAQVGYVFFINGDVNGESMKIEYVHELQNLFFALRKQELEMKGGNNE